MLSGDCIKAIRPLLKKSGRVYLVFRINEKYKNVLVDFILDTYLRKEELFLKNNELKLS